LPEGTDELDEPTAELAIESITQQTNPFGTTNVSHTPIGLEQTPDITLGGLFDDTALVGPHVVFQIATADKAPGSVGRVLTILAATGKTFTITVHLVKYTAVLKGDGLTEYTAVLRQKSAGVWS
jgi:hypothetical protein